MKDLDNFFTAFLSRYWACVKEDTRPLVPHLGTLFYIQSQPPLTCRLGRTLGRYIKIQEYYSEEVRSSVDEKVVLMNLNRYRSCYEAMTGESCVHDSLQDPKSHGYAFPGTEMESVQRKYNIPRNENVRKAIKRSFEVMDTSKPSMEPYRYERPIVWSEIVVLIMSLLKNDDIP